MQKKILNLVEIFSVCGTFSKAPTGASPLDLTGGLLSPRPSKSAFLHWFTAQIPPCPFPKFHKESQSTKFAIFDKTEETCANILIAHKDRSS